MPRLSVREGRKYYSVRLFDEKEHPLSWVVGGEKVILRVIASGASGSEFTNHWIFRQRPLRTNPCLVTIPFYRTWIEIFCALAEANPGRFCFLYAITTCRRLQHYGCNCQRHTGQEHVQHHWIHDAIMFKSETSSVSTGSSAYL